MPALGAAFGGGGPADASAADAAGGEDAAKTAALGEGTTQTPTNPFKPLNWLGRATHQRDRYGDFQGYLAKNAVGQQSAKDLVDYQAKSHIDSIGPAARESLKAALLAKDAEDARTAAGIGQYNKETADYNAAKADAAKGTDLGPFNIPGSPVGPQPLTPSLWKYGYGERGAQIGAPAANELMMRAQARTPGAAEEETIAQGERNATAGLTTIAANQGKEWRGLNPSLVSAELTQKAAAQGIANDSSQMNLEHMARLLPGAGDFTMGADQLRFDGNGNLILATSGGSKPGLVTDPKTGKLIPGEVTAPPITASRPGIKSPDGKVSYTPDRTDFSDGWTAPSTGHVYGRQRVAAAPAPVPAGLTPSFSRAPAPFYDVSQIGVNPPETGQPWPTPMALPAGDESVSPWPNLQNLKKWFNKPANNNRFPTSF